MTWDRSSDSRPARRPVIEDAAEPVENCVRRCADARPQGVTRSAKSHIAIDEFVSTRLLEAAAARVRSQPQSVGESSTYKIIRAC